MAANRKVRKKTSSKRKKGTGKRTIIESQCFRHRNIILGGTVLAIDPSSGSEESQPGYALFKDGILLEYGTVEIGTKRSSGGLANRLFMLRSYLMEEFPRPDLVCIERCPFLYANMAAARLQQVMGVVKSCWNVPAIEVSPASWKKWTHALPEGITYEKRDDLDALTIGTCVVGIARLLRKFQEESNEDKE